MAHCCWCNLMGLRLQNFHQWEARMVSVLTNQKLGLSASPSPGPRPAIFSQVKQLRQRETSPSCLKIFKLSATLKRTIHCNVTIESTEEEKNGHHFVLCEIMIWDSKEEDWKVWLFCWPDSLHHYPGYPDITWSLPFFVSAFIVCWNIFLLCHLWIPIIDWVLFIDCT